MPSASPCKASKERFKCFWTRKEPPAPLAPRWSRILCFRSDAADELGLSRFGAVAANGAKGNKSPSEPELCGPFPARILGDLHFGSCLHVSDPCGRTRV